MESKDKQKKIISGKFPEFGAIFMSNGSTMEECLEKKLFGLPICHSDFVRRVKAGMILFLFEYEKRKLYGVFEATSDGETDIVPHAYSSSGRRFPAQVRITTIWQCHPVSEHEFHDAIKENYFATKQFNFGLSKDQVCKLLWLFNSRRVSPKSQSFTKIEVRKQHQKSPRNKREMEEDRFNHSDSVRRKLNINTGTASVVSFGEADVPHSNLEPLGYSTKVVLEKDDSRWLASRDVDVTLNQPDNTLYDHSYCPEAPCFQSSLAFGTSGSVSGCELGTYSNHATQSQPVTSGEEPEKLNICSGSLNEDPEKLNISSGSLNNDLGDFIPLPPLDDSDPEEANISFLEARCSENNLMESAAFESLSEPFVLPKPNLVGESFRQENTDLPIAASIPDGGQCDVNVESSNAAFPLSNTGNCLLNEGAYGLKSEVVDCQEHSDLDNSEHRPRIKGLYSDTPIKRTSVFSRLNFDSKSPLQEKVDYTRENSSLHVISAQKKHRKKVGKSVCKMSLKREYHTGVDKSVQEIMEELQQRHVNWWKTGRRAKSFEREDEDCTKEKKASVFLRLTRTSEAGVQENGIAIRFRQGNGKRKKSVLEREDNSRGDKSVNKSAKRLQQNVSCRKKMVRETEISITHHDYEEKSNKSTQMEIVNYASRGNEGDQENIWSRRGMAEDISCLDFKHRGEMLETQSETEKASCIIGVDRNCSLENQCKRKLVESFLSDVKTITHDRCPNLQMPSQESSTGKDCTGSCDAAVKSERNDDDDDELSRRDQVSSVILRMPCEVEDGEIVEGLTDKESKLGELDGARVCCVSGAVTKQLKTYKRRCFVLCSSDNMVTVGEGKAECSRASIGTKGGAECGNLLPLTDNRPCYP